MSLNLSDHVRDPLPPAVSAATQGLRAEQNVPPSHTLLALQEALTVLSARAQNKARAFERALHEVQSRSHGNHGKRFAGAATKKGKRRRTTVASDEESSSGSSDSDGDKHDKLDEGEDDKAEAEDDGEGVAPDEDEEGAAKGDDAARPFRKVKLEPADLEVRGRSLALPDRSILTPELLRTKDPQEIAKVLGVAVYPTNDLSDLLPGKPATEDFSKAKPTNQIAATTFQAYLEPYFRPLTEEDLAFLREPGGDPVTPFMIPALGPHYTELWTEGTADMIDSNGSITASAAATAAAATKAVNGAPLEPVVPRGSIEQLTDESLVSDEVSCGPLTERLLSALVRVDELALEVNGNTDVDGSADDEGRTKSSDLSVINEAQREGIRIAASKADFSEIEERVQRELQYVGILGGGRYGSAGAGEEVDWTLREDDEISANLRSLQRQLAVQASTNRRRKRRLLRCTRDFLAYQEYASILEDLDRQVEHAFAKRVRTSKLKRKRDQRSSVAAAAAASKAVLDPIMRSLLDKRQKWITKIGAVFGGGTNQQNDPILYTRIPSESIYQGLDDDPDPDQTAA